jgi:hypothetical protein
MPFSYRIDFMGGMRMWATWLVVTVMTAGQTAQAQPAGDASPPLDADPAAQLNEPAQTQDTPRPLALVSVESSLRWLKGDGLRRAIRKQTGYEVISPDKAGDLQYRARVANAPVMVVTISRRGVVTLVCRNAPEGAQWIRVKTPMRSVVDATATLAAAMLSATYEYQAKLAELQRGVTQRAAMTPRLALPPAAALEIPGNPYWRALPPPASALEMPGNPYYRPMPMIPARPYLPPYNPYYLPHFDSQTLPCSI